MTYLQNADTALHELLKSLPLIELQEAKKAIKIMILDSYKNGIEAGKQAVKKPLRTRFPRSA